jgi:molecular chaperone GrpE
MRKAGMKNGHDGAGNGVDQTSDQTMTQTMAGEASRASGDGPEAELAVLRDRLRTAEQEAAEARASWQRSAADFQNYRRRTEQEREQSLGLASELLLRKLLPIADDLRRAFDNVPDHLRDDAWVSGLRLVERKFEQLLESEGMEAIPAQGEPFDPRWHEAIAHEETTTAPDGHVIEELQRGYRLRDRVLRPALVKVASNTAETSTGQAAGSGGVS